MKVLYWIEDWGNRGYDWLIGIIENLIQYIEGGDDL